MQQYVTTFEQSQKLKEIGVSQESIFFWAITDVKDKPQLAPYDTAEYLNYDKSEIYSPEYDIYQE